MKKISWIVLICVSALSISFCPTVYAENKAHTGTFTVGGNGLFFASKRNMENSGGPFVAAAYNFTPEWGIEGMLASFNTHFRPSENDHRSINGTLVLVDAVYHFPPYFRYTNVQPYALAGVGIMGLSHNRDDANNEGAINAGLGLQVFVDQVVSFRIEARDVYTMVGSKNDIFLGGGVSFSMGGC